MPDPFPLHPLQLHLDAHGALAIAFAIARMGPSFQITQMGHDEQGFFIDGLQYEKIESAWLDELMRLGLQFWKEPWGELETMMGDNLREFWRYRGQKVRARQSLPKTLEVVAWGGERELAPEPYWPKRPAIEAIALRACPQQSVSLKGHAEKAWRLEGRVLATRQAKRAYSQNLKIHDRQEAGLKGSSTILNLIELESLLKLENLFFKSLKDSGLNIFYPCQPLAKASPEGLWWKRVTSDSVLREKRLWNEGHKQAVGWQAHGSKEEILRQLSECLLSIRKVVNMLGLEVEHHLVVPPAVDPEALINLVAKAWNLEDVQQVNCHQGGLGSSAHWALWGYDSSGVWWKLSQCEITKESASSWRGSGDVVTSFERWLALDRERAGSISSEVESF